MIWIELGTGAVEPVSQDEAKRFLRLERDDEDALLATCLKAARETVEAETGLFLAPRRMRLALEVDPRVGHVHLRRRPVHSVVAALGFDEAGTAFPLEAAGFALTGEPFGTRLTVPPGLAVRAQNGLELDLDVGHPATLVAEALKLAILRLAAASFETRGIVPSGLQPAFMPPLVRALTAPFRVPRL